TKAGLSRPATASIRFATRSTSEYSAPDETIRARFCRSVFAYCSFPSCICCLSVSPTCSSRFVTGVFWLRLCSHRTPTTSAAIAIAISGRARMKPSTAFANPLMPQRSPSPFDLVPRRASLNKPCCCPWWDRIFTIAPLSIPSDRSRHPPPRRRGDRGPAADLPYIGQRRAAFRSHRSFALLLELVDGGQHIQNDQS